VEDLNLHKLDHSVKLNILYDWSVGEAQQLYTADPEADVYPLEQWALYSRYPATWNVAGHINHAILKGFSHHNMLHYVHHKHGLDMALINGVEAEELGKYLLSLPIHWCIRQQS
jgi:hypothetical protein